MVEGGPKLGLLSHPLDLLCYSRQRLLDKPSCKQSAYFSLEMCTLLCRAGSLHCRLSSHHSVSTQDASSAKRPSLPTLSNTSSTSLPATQSHHTFLPESAETVFCIFLFSCLFPVSPLEREEPLEGVFHESKEDVSLVDSWLFRTSKTARYIESIQ